MDTENYSLKRGESLECDHKDWRSPKAEWYFKPVYVPNYMERFCGIKTFFGRPYGVFQAMDDGFLAQDMDVIMAKRPTNPMAIVSILPKEAHKMTDEQPTPGLKEALKFSGTNWKLCGDKKWKAAGEIEITDLKKVGQKQIKTVLHDIYQGPDCFFAVQT